MIDRRLYPRIESSLFIRYRVSGTSVDWSSFSQDISNGGLRMFSAERLLPETPLEITIDIPEVEDYFYAEAEVRWVSDMPNRDELGNDVYALGIMFTFSETVCKEYLENYLQQYT